MRAFLLLLSLSCAVPAVAQSQTGRHFQRDSRQPVTAAAAGNAAAVEATAHTKAVAPLPKLRSGRPWPAYHFSRLPAVEPVSDVQAVDASASKSSASKPSASKRGFWHKHG